MRSPEYVAHGTSSEKDAENIIETGFEAQEGRATVSGHLIYAFEWAKKQERRVDSKSESEIDEGEKGRMVIMQVPEEKSVGYATHTSIEVDEESKEISGFTSKYESGRKQLGIFDGNEITDSKKRIEQAKKGLKETNAEFLALLAEYGIDPNSVKSKSDLIEAIKGFDIEKQIDILKRAEPIEAKRSEKKLEAEPNVQISQENILMSIVPTPELGERLAELSQKIRGLEKVDLEIFTEELSKIIENNKDNFLASGIDVREVVKNLLSSTMETEVMNMIRSLSMDVKRSQGYKVYNRGKDEVKEKEVNKEQLKIKLEKILSVVETENFDIGMENLNRYIKMNIKKFLEELK